MNWTDEQWLRYDRALRAGTVPSRRRAAVGVGSPAWALWLLAAVLAGALALTWFENREMAAALQRGSQATQHAAQEAGR